MNGVEVLGSWLTPTVLFCVLNVVVAFIFFLNPHRKHTQDHNSPQLVRVPSLFERVKSFNLSAYRSDRQPDPTYHTTVPVAEQEEPVSHRYGSEETTHAAVSRDQTKPAAREPRPAARETKQAAREPRPAVRETKPAEREAKPVERETKPVARRLKKSASEKMQVQEAEEEVDQRRPATVREKPTVSHGDEAVDSKADDFISKFRQQLKLQRLDSILRYKEMLNRGT